MLKLYNHSRKIKRKLYTLTMKHYFFDEAYKRKLDHSIKLQTSYTYVKNMAIEFEQVTNAILNSRGSPGLTRSDHSNGLRLTW